MDAMYGHMVYNDNIVIMQLYENKKRAMVATTYSKHHHRHHNSKQQQTGDGGKQQTPPDTGKNLFHHNLSTDVPWKIAPNFSALRCPGPTPRKLLEQ